MQVHELISSANVQAVVAEVPESKTPPGLALELHLLVIRGQSIALVLDDRRLANRVAVYLA